MAGQTSFCLPAYRRSALWKGRGCFPGWYTFTVLCVTGLLMFSEAQGYVLVGSVRPSHYMFLWGGFFLNGLLQLLPGSTQPLVPGIFLPRGLFSRLRYWQDFTKVHPPWLSQAMRDLHIFVQRWHRGCFLALFLSVPPSFFPSSLTSQRQRQGRSTYLLAWVDTSGMNCQSSSLLRSPISDIYRNSEGEIKARTSTTG